MKIEKTAGVVTNCLQKIHYYQSARNAMNDLFQSLVTSGRIQTLLLPGYIGWSPKEGSGIFDAVTKIPGLNIIYYQMDYELQIDFENLKDLIKAYPKSAVLIVNYFGFRDSNYSLICDYIRNHSGLLVEDNAHGFYTYYNSGYCKADATFFSYHKMFPVSYGGGLKLLSPQLNGLKLTKAIKSIENFCEWEYDIAQICEIRRTNYQILDNMIKKYTNFNSPIMKPLHRVEELTLANIPQTYPLRILKGNRDYIYEVMNNNGFGVVSLYHTLIPELNEKKYIQACQLSKCILNLPVHQDVNTDYYEEMLSLLSQLCIQTNDMNGVNHADRN